MNNIFKNVKNSPLWNGIAQEHFEKMLKCIEANVKHYNKNDIIILTGGEIRTIGMILSGRIKIMKEDLSGNAVLLTELLPSEMFGETLVCAGIDRSPVTVQAADDCCVLFINYKKVISTCRSACSFHLTLIENMLKLLADKNIILNRKIEILSKRTLREKLLTFFDLQRGTDSKFKIPYNREELAQYICADRSAVSGELCKMRNEGIILFKKNEFEIL